MSHGQQTFKKRDVTRAVRAVQDAGEKVQRVEVDKEGKIIVTVGEAHQDLPTRRSTSGTAKLPAPRRRRAVVV
jgi:hypothetical protein